MFYLVRHGEPDNSEKDTKVFKNFGENLLPLTPKGIEQIKETAKDLRLRNADIILSSPYTRALQTAAILSKELQVDIVVETNLHEWVADKNYVFLEREKAEKHFVEYNELSGVYPQGSEKEWESDESLRDRMRLALEKYKHLDKVIVCCHGTLIQSVSNGYKPGYGEIIELGSV